MSEAHETENGDHYHETNSPDYSQMAPQVDDSNTTYIYEAPSVAVALTPSNLSEANGHSHAHHLKRAVVVTTDPRDRIVASAENTNGTTTVYVEASDVEELRYAGAHVRYEEDSAYQGRYEYHPAAGSHQLSTGGGTVQPEDIKVEMVRAHQHQQQHQEIHIYEQHEEPNRHGPPSHQHQHHQHQSDVPKAHYTNLEPAHQNYYLPDGFQPPNGFPYFTSSKEYPIFNPVSSNSVLYKGE